MVGGELPIDELNALSPQSRAKIITTLRNVFSLGGR
jgi:hypothetical protein